MFLSSVILTGSPDCSILAIDIETGSPASYGWMFIQLGIIFNIHTVSYGWMFQVGADVPAQIFKMSPR